MSLCISFKPLNQLQKKKGRGKQPEPVHIKATLVDMNLQSTLKLGPQGVQMLLGTCMCTQEVHNPLHCT